MAYMLGFWICFMAFAVAALYRLLVVRRIRTELGASNAEWNSNFMELLKEHKARFPVSSTRTLSNTLIAVQMIVAAMGVVLFVSAQFQPHSFFHLLSAAR